MTQFTYKTDMLRLNAAAKTYNGMLQENLDPEALIAEEDQAES